jgi:2-dehydropantoate 2-reductase
MNIIILGSGAIGSLIGAILSKKNDVLLIGRKPHVDKINKDGLAVKGAVNEKFKVKADTKIRKIGPETVIFLATKAADTEKSIYEIRHLIRDDTIIVCMQNGLGTEEIIKNIVRCEVVRGVITVAVTFLNNGEINCNSMGHISLGKSHGSEKILRVLKESALNAEISNNIYEDMWKKLLLNCILNPLTAILRVENNEIFRLMGVVKIIGNEVLEVAKTQGIFFDEEKVFKEIEAVFKNSGKNKSSMYQDIMKGRKTEIDFINGAVVKIGKEHNVDVKANEIMVGLVKCLEKPIKTKI